MRRTSPRRLNLKKTVVIITSSRMMVIIPENNKIGGAQIRDYQLTCCECRNDSIRLDQGATLERNNDVYHFGRNIYFLLWCDASLQATGEENVNNKVLDQVKTKTRRTHTLQSHVFDPM
jgi:hypothetical protein